MLFRSTILVSQEKELREANAAKDKFFNIIAHDLKNPLHTAMGLAELLNLRFDKSSSDKKKRLINGIHKNLQNTHNLLENLLQWSRSQTGKLEAKPQYFYISDVIEAEIEKCLKLVKGKSMEIDQTGVKRLMVFADYSMISVIVHNLICNAIKYSWPESQITVSSDLTESMSVQVNVMDNGIGIPEAQKLKMFVIDKSFMRQGTQGEMGTGLGLIISKDFIEKNRGKIWFKSSEGLGSTFSITVPRE